MFVIVRKIRQWSSLTAECDQVQLKFISIQQGYKTFYKVYIYIEFVLQFVRNNTK